MLGILERHETRESVGKMKVTTRVFFSVIYFVTSFLGKGVCADESKPFVSELFEKGTLVYEDDFSGKYSPIRWGALRNDRKIEDGKLIATPRFGSKDEAMRVLKRDHHLGLEPVIHLNQIPEAFVCHIRYKFDAEALTPGRPCFQIGHHMIVLTFLEGGGHQVRLPNGKVFKQPDSKATLSQWIDLVIEYKMGKILINLNGKKDLYEDEGVTIINENDKLGPRFSIKGGPDCKIIFDSVQLWSTE